MAEDPRLALLEYCRETGTTYGTEDFSVFLYSYVKMSKPDRVVELGTGVGTCALLIAQALKENGKGSLFSVDDGSHWDNLQHHPVIERLRGGATIEAQPFFTRLAKQLEVDAFVQFAKHHVPPLPSFELPLDLLFSDFDHSPDGILTLLRHYLPQMASVSSIFIDSASTHLPSCLLLEALCREFNQGTMPASMLVGTKPDRAEKLKQFVARHQFQLIHMVENKDREQNSTAWIKIQPRDFVPHPLVMMH